MNLGEAKSIADKWLDDLLPFCERVKIAGSIRRKKPDVKDIEIVAIPSLLYSEDLLGQSVLVANELNDYLARSNLAYNKCGDKYKQIVLPEGINLDLFIVLPPAQWGVIFTIRTGPASFSKRVVTKKKYGGAMPGHLRVKDGALIIMVDRIIDTPEEGDFFDAIGLDWIEPEERC